MLSLSTIRDLLLPGVVHHVNRRFGPFSGVEGDLLIRDLALDLKITRGGAIYIKQIFSAKDIADGTYRDKFGVRMVWLLNGAADVLGEPERLKG